jgi:ComF family protein
MATMVYKCMQQLQTLLFPSTCRLCGGPGDQVPGLCRPCLADAPWITTACQRCGRALPAASDVRHCGRCQRHPPAYDATTALFHYRPPVDYLIKRLKFAGELSLVPMLATLLAARLRTRAAVLPELLIPVPLHSCRLRERGFNQATELARCVGRELAIENGPRCCQRHRNTQPQSLLSPTARRINLRNAFSLRDTSLPRHVAIVDDVMTTGHTSNELARVLKQAGVERIEVWVIARAG